MPEAEERYREILVKIAEVADTALNGSPRPRHDASESHEDDEDIPGCTIRSLPGRVQVEAAEIASRINPANRAHVAPMLDLTVGPGVSEPLRLAVLTAKYWGPKARTITVSFLDNPPADLRKRIISHMNAWTKTGCISFAETSGVGQVRISRGDGGYWSYLGTDILLIPKNRPTMNLQGFTMNTPESEYKRVVRHETGHTMGFPHEHMRKDIIARIDRQKAYDFFLSAYGWDRTTVDQQVLTPLDEKSLMGTKPDQTSIMCYQLPGSITKDGKPIVGGLDINGTDYSFVARIYPRPGPHKAMGTPTAVGDWPESEDVHLDAHELAG